MLVLAAPAGVAVSDCLVERGRLAARTVNAVSAAGSLVVSAPTVWGVPSLVRIDVALPGYLVQAASWEPRFYVADVALVGSTAVAAADTGLVTLDVSNPWNPRELAFMDIRLYADELAVDGELVFSFSNGAGGNISFDVIDVSDPEDPQQRGSLHWGRPGPPEPFKSAIDAFNGTVVMVDDDGLMILDVSDPRRPAEVARWQRHDARDAALLDGLVAVAVASWDDPEDAAVEVVDLADPAAPALVGSWPAPSATNAVTRYGDAVAVGTELDGLFLLDLGDPTHPTVLEHWNSHGIAVRNLAGAWPNLVAGHDDQGLTVLGRHPSCLPPRRPAGRADG